jgi:quercetin dioxygenase-like cupin family protein
MSVLIQHRDDAERLGRAVLLAATDDATVMEFTVEPGSEPGEPHHHKRHTDSFYVIEGELEFVIEGRTVRAPAGTLVTAPRGASHAFPVAVGGTARFLNVHSPGGFEHYMRALVAMRERGETPNRDFFESHDQYNE